MAPIPLPEISQEAPPLLSVPPEMAVYRKSLQIAVLLFMRAPQSEATSKILSLLRPLATLLQTAEGSVAPKFFITPQKLGALKYLLGEYGFQIAGFKRAKWIAGKTQENQAPFIRLALKIMRSGVLFRCLERIIASAQEQEPLEEIYAKTIARISVGLEKRGRFRDEVRWIVDGVKTRTLQVTLPSRDPEKQKLPADEVIERIIAEIVAKGKFRNAPEFTESVGWHRNRVRTNILSPLVSRGVLRCYGRGSGAFYLAVENFPHTRTKARIPLHQLRAKILALADGEGSFSIDARRVRSLGWHRNTISEIARVLNDEGLLEREGKTRWAVYRKNNGNGERTDEVSPLRRRVREAILDKFGDGNDAFRTTPAFLETVKADRGTVKIVLDELVHDGLLERRGGKRGPTVHFVRTASP
jgi:hypothetical protein